MLYPIFVLPYTTRVLGPEAFGRVNFAQNLVAYLSLVAVFGLQVLGIREIAKVRDDEEKLKKLFSELFTISLATTLISCVAYLVIVNYGTRFSNYRFFYSIFFISILFGGLSIEWLYGGLERFRYIAIRSALFKIASIPLLLVFVRRESDFVAFAIISIFAGVGSTLVNLFGARRLFRMDLAIRGWKTHGKSAAYFFIITVVSSTSVSLPALYLGFLSNERSVAFYSAVFKIIQIILTVTNSLSAVLLPHLSYTYEKDLGRFKHMTENLFRFVNIIGIPCAFGLSILADRILRVVAGEKFLGAVGAMQLMSFVVLLSVNSSFFVQQILYPKKLEKIFLITSIFTAVFALVMGYLGVMKYGLMGATLCYLATEGILLISVWVYCGLRHEFSSDFFSVMKYLLSSGGMSAVLLLEGRFLPQSIASLFLLVIGGALSYFAVLLLFRDKFLLNTIARLQLRVT